MSPSPSCIHLMLYIYVMFDVTHRHLWHVSLTAHHDGLTAQPSASLRNTSASLRNTSASLRTTAHASPSAFLLCPRHDIVHACVSSHDCSSVWSGGVKTGPPGISVASRPPVIPGYQAVHLSAKTGRYGNRGP